MLNSRPPLSLFSSSLVADPAQEAVEKVGRDFLKALGRMPSDEGAVPKSKATSAELS
jgi:hypothetical protein